MDAATLISTFREIAAIEMDDGIVFDTPSLRADAIREDTPLPVVLVNLGGSREAR